MERLQKAVGKAVEQFRKPAVNRFAPFNTDKGKALLYFNRIILVRTAVQDSRDKEVLLQDGQVMLLKNISFDALSEVLPPNGFCRVNKKEILALSAIRFFSHDEITLQATDKNGKPITVGLSEKYRPDFLEKVNG
ncbi:hypothetical protein [Flavobacterium sp.]|uniref:hypothetical protein n=1 Tax=Flavobacterium sp. TaxID=239 RepID=UPI0039E5EA96